MAYNNYPMGYYYPTQYQQPMQQPIQQPIQQNMPAQPVQNVQQPQIQDGGTVYVQNEKEARNYLVANGTSVTFIDTKAMRLYIKTRGFSSFDQPVFERYSLVKIPDNEESTEEVQTEEKTVDYASKEDIESIKKEIRTLKSRVTKLTEKNTEKGGTNE